MIRLDAHLLHGPEGAVRLLVGGVVLDIDERDVVEIDAAGATREGAVAVRVVLARGSRVLDLGPDVRDLPVPFAVAARAGDRFGGESPAFRAREDAYVVALDAFDARLA